ncbi:MAG TPA: nuclear transport factor 2 family protein [Candidatus Saccharimonadales bacterium]
MTNPTHASGIELFDRWTAYWNEDYAQAGAIMAPNFTLHYAQAGGERFDSIHTPEQMTEIIKAWHTMRKNIVFKPEGECVVDLTESDGGLTGLVARPYFVAYDGDDGERVSRSGTDILKIADGKIVEVWSVSSGVQGRTFYPVVA